MSEQGIGKFAEVLTLLQQTRLELLGGDNQDIRLGQLLFDAEESVKDQFTKETLVSK